MDLTEINDSEVEKNIVYIFVTAMVVFFFNILIGMINGLNLIEFNRAAVIFHVHAGTIGWLSVSTFAIIIWYFSRNRKLDSQSLTLVKWIVRFVVIGVPLYVVSFWIAFELEDLAFWLLPVFGTITGLAFLMVLTFIILQIRKVETLQTPHILFLGGLLSASYGGFFGLILGIQRATGELILPTDADQIGTHAGAMEVGFLFMVIAAIVEWQFYGDNKEKINILGWIQAGVFFLAGLTTVLGLLMNLEPLIMLFLPLQIIGAILLIIRLIPQIRKIFPFNITDSFFVISYIFLFISIVLYFYLIFNFLILEGIDPADLAGNPDVFKVFKATAHVLFVGSTTGAIFGMISLLTIKYKDTLKWGELLTLVIMYVGLIGFIFALILDWGTEIAAVMGIGLLVGYLTYGIRLKKFYDQIT